MNHFITALITQTSACFVLLLLLCSAVKFTSKLFGRALSKRIKATVLYATETGKSEQYAKQLCELLGHAFNAQVSWQLEEILIKHLLSWGKETNLKNKSAHFKSNN